MTERALQVSINSLKTILSVAMFAYYAPETFYGHFTLMLQRHAMSQCQDTTKTSNGFFSECSFNFKSILKYQC